MCVCVCVCVCVAWEISKSVFFNNLLQLLSSVASQLTVSLKADGNGIHESEGPSILHLVPTSSLADDDLVTEQEENSTTSSLYTGT